MLVEVAPGLYLREGLQQDASADNRGHIANIGFVVGDARVAVIDTGGSLQEGRDLLRAIRQVTKRPIGYVILTHMHPDHVFGAAAFTNEEVEVVGHANLEDALLRREPFYMAGLQAQLGSLAEGSLVVRPDSIVKPGTVRKLDLGGRVIELQAYPTAHTNNDVSVYDPETGTLWLSDLLFVERTPVLDGSLLGWLRVMDSLETHPALQVVPGHGPVSPDWKADLNRQRSYWGAVATGVRRLIRNNGTIKQAVASVAREQRDHWLLFDAYHGRNITAAYVELEWE